MAAATGAKVQSTVNKLDTRVLGSCGTFQEKQVLALHLCWCVGGVLWGSGVQATIKQLVKLLSSCGTHQQKQVTVCGLAGLPTKCQGKDAWMGRMFRLCITAGLHQII